MTERRYSAEEVSAIFEQAAQAEQSGRLPAGRSQGMTLAEVQAVGAEAGIPTELVRQAARSLDHRPQPANRSFLGLPFRVGLNVSLHRTLSDAEWERFVVDLRETFDARGVVRQDGSLRQWTNGNLQVLVEPYDGGYRVRFRTMNGSVGAYVAAGLAMGVGGAFALLTAVVGQGLVESGAVVSAGLMTLVGGGLMSAGALRLPGWARLRRRQMEELSRRLVERLAASDEQR
jgi:hypothetical protein